MAEKKEIEVINIREIAKKIRANKKSFYLPLGIVFVLSCIYIFSLSFVAPPTRTARSALA